MYEYLTSTQEIQLEHFACAKYQNSDLIKSDEMNRSCNCILGEEAMKSQRYAFGFWPNITRRNKFLFVEGGETHTF